MISGFSSSVASMVWQPSHFLPMTVPSSAFILSVFASSSEALSQAVADELLRRVRLLAGLARRAQVVDRRGDGPWIAVERHRHQLS